MRLPEQNVPRTSGLKLHVCVRVCIQSPTMRACVHSVCHRQKPNLGTVRTLHCVPSIASAAFLGQIEFLPRTCSTQFSRFRRKEEKKVTSNIALKGTRATTTNTVNPEYLVCILFLSLSCAAASVENIMHTKIQSKS